MKGREAIHGRSGSGWCSQYDLTGEPLVAAVGYTTFGDTINVSVSRWRLRAIDRQQVIDPIAVGDGASSPRRDLFARV
jgi:hypothetical protein